MTSLKTLGINSDVSNCCYNIGTNDTVVYILDDFQVNLDCTHCVCREMTERRLERGVVKTKKRTKLTSNQRCYFSKYVFKWKRHDFFIFSGAGVELISYSNWKRVQ